MGHWWRAHDEAIDDPKLLLLSDRLHRAWFNVMCLASANDGAVPEIAIVAIKLRLTKPKAAKVLVDLTAAKLLDEVDGRLQPHNWSARQFKSDARDSTNAERQKRYRNRYANGPPAVTETVTVPVTNPVTITPPILQSTEKKDAADAAPPDLERQLFERGKQVCGKEAGGLIAKLLKAKKGDVALARAAIEMAATKQNPREYLGAVISGGHASIEGRRLTNDEQYWGVGRIPGIT